MALRQKIVKLSMLIMSISLILTLFVAISLEALSTLVTSPNQEISNA